MESNDMLSIIIKLFGGVVEQLKDIPFFVYGLPVLTLIGGGAFLYYGLTGVFKKRTIGLGAPVVGSHRRVNVITGRPAQFVGIFYLLIDIPICCGLGVLSYFLLAAQWN